MTGVILAGGQSKRMERRNKALFSLGRETIIARTVRVFRRLFDEILIITNIPGPYRDLGCRLAADILPGNDSIGGLYTGLVEARHPQSFFAACDMPFLNENLIRRQMEGSEDFDVVIPVSSYGYQPMHGIYSKNCIAPIERQIQQGDLKIVRFFPEVRVREFGVEEIHKLDPEEISFFNVNTPVDWEQAWKLSDLWQRQQEGRGDCDVDG